ncbi:MAG: 5'/3'-nucleotidase SurE [Thermoanaerobaculales bacterium]|jgi:5'-nucleotidase|nr:5'/3'-nucleotidase SurE [Thermoanaerobaculales bacterium]
MQRTLSALTIVVALLLAFGLPVGAGDPVHVMLANDDGIDAPGLAAMAAALAADPAYRVTVVAPKHQQSVSGHALVTRSEVEVTAHEAVAGCPAWSVAGTPATVALVGLTALLVDDPPQLVVSGINSGENDGLGAWTSGTVAVAREGAFAGIPAVAVSLQLDWSDPRPDFAAAARWAKPVIDAVREHGLPPATYLNVSIPRDPSAIRGYRVARMGLDPSEVARYVAVRVDDDGTRWYSSLWKPPAAVTPGGDTHAMAGGWVTLVPLGLDLTVDSAIPFLLQLGIPSPPPSGEALQR